MRKFKDWFMEKFFLEHYLGSLRGGDIHDYVHRRGRTPEEVARLESLLPSGIADIIRPRTLAQEQEIMRRSAEIAERVKAGKV